MAQDNASASSAKVAGNLKGEALLEALKADHWFWQWGNENWRKDFEVPDGMVNPDLFMNLESGEVKTFLSELQQDGLALVPDLSPNQRPDRASYLIDRVEFMEWLIVRYLKETPTYSADELEAYAGQKVAEAKSVWEMEAEEVAIDHHHEITRAEMQSEAARSGWISLDKIATYTGVNVDELVPVFANRYTLGLNSGDSWLARWFDAFEWLQEHFAAQWDATSERARRDVAYLVEQGISEPVALDKVRREFINERAALPVNEEVGIHTLTDTTHLLGGHSIIGLDAQGDTISTGFVSGWDPNSEKEAEWGFPIRGEGSGY